MSVPSSWFKPIINSVFIPAHAMMSSCSTSHIVGRWSYTTRITQSSFYVNLLANGEGDEETNGGTLTWTFDGINRVIVTIPVDPLYGIMRIYDGTIGAPYCNHIAGDVNNNRYDIFVANKESP